MVDFTKFPWNTTPLAYLDPRARQMTPLPGESNFGYGARTLPLQIINAGNQAAASSPFNPMVFGANVHDDIAKAWNYGAQPAAGNPQHAAAKPAVVPAGMTSYKSPGYDDLDRQAAARAGIPFQMLSAIRLHGEKSNADQVSSAGARTVYQITPGTRKLFQNKYGVDAYASPENAAYVAALHLKESMQRGEDPIRGYIGGPDKSKWGHDTMAYGDRVNGALAMFGDAVQATGMNAPPPPLNTAGYGQAQSLLNQAAQNNMRPFSATYQETPLPELPKPTPLQAPDYTKGDADFAAAAPKNPFGSTPEEQSKGELKMRRAEYFAGIGQALASYQDGMGLGALFAKMGGGALMGAAHGDAMVRDKTEKFDAAMQQYQLAKTSRDDGKAREAVAVANANTQELDKYAMLQWQKRAQDIQAHNPVVRDGVLTTFNKTPDGKTVETHTPLDPARNNAILMAKGNLAIAQQNATNEYGWQVFQNNRAVAAAALPYAMADAQASGDYQQRDSIFAVGLMEAGTALTDTGRWKDLYASVPTLGTDRAASIEREAMAAAGMQLDTKGRPIPGTKPTAEQQEIMKNYISTALVTDFVGTGNSWRLVGGETKDKNTGKRLGRREPDSTVVSSVGVTRERDKRVSVRTDAKGRQTSTESY